MNDKMLLKVILIAVFAIIPVISEKPVKGESVFLNDGSIIGGAVISDSADSLTIRTDDNSVKQIKRSDVKRILYTKLKMAKVFIQKRDGKAIVAFIVDEDQDTYTYRTELYSPEEFILKRSDVLFMAEKNPSGLQPDGDAGTDRVTLTWLAPYGEVKKYNIYIKKSGNSKYELTESTKNKSVILKNLSSNTTYFIIVTSVDMDDYESTPSNELKIKTANLRPDKPEIISAERNPVDRTITYSWKPASDPDGKVVKYRIFRIWDGRREPVSEVNATVYTVKDPESYKSIELAAVDDQGDESDTVDLNLFKNRYIMGIYPGVIMPLGKFGKMAGTGYGGMSFFAARDLLFEGFDSGLGVGFYHARGKDLSGEKKSIFDSFMIIPVLINNDYRIKFYDNFFISPSVSFGMSYIAISYKNIDPLKLVYVKKSKSVFDPTFIAGIGAEYVVRELFSVSVNGGYGMFIEKDGPMQFVSMSLGFKYMF